MDESKLKPGDPKLLAISQQGRCFYCGEPVGAKATYDHFIPQCYGGIDDIANKKPPLGATGIGGGSGIYRNIGRFFYAGFVVDLK